MDLPEAIINDLRSKYDSSKSKKYISLRLSIPNNFDFISMYENSNQYPKACLSTDEGTLEFFLDGLIIWKALDFEEYENKISSLKSEFLFLSLNNILHSPTIYGGFAFNPDSNKASKIWEEFGSSYFFLPKWYILQANEKLTLEINLKIVDYNNYDEILNSLEASFKEFQVLASLTNNENISNQKLRNKLESNFETTYTTWENGITSILNQLETTNIQKIVLSRIKNYNSKKDISSKYILNNLISTQNESNIFFFEPVKDSKFFGATPELLINKSGNKINTIALAGSEKRGSNAETDAEYAELLLNRSKDRNEHDIVVNEITRKLRAISFDINVSDVPFVIKYHNIQHLRSNISATLNTELSIMKLIQKLHPTPAVGGYPGKNMQNVIEKLEEHYRGWYAGVIGKCNLDMDGKFFVAIRSAVNKANNYEMYAGAGIVGNSLPKNEWEETEIKFLPILNALGVIE